MKKKLLLGIAAILLLAVAAVGIGKAYAYFTTYVEAKGSKTIHLGDTTTITEEYANWQKTVTITNSADSAQAVWVRVQAFAGSEYALAYSGEGWSDGGDGWYYYSAPVEPGKASAAIVVSIKNKDGGELAAEDGKDFNVVVVYETTPAVQNGVNEQDEVQYLPADWGTAPPAEGSGNNPMIQ